MTYSPGEIDNELGLSVTLSNVDISDSKFWPLKLMHLTGKESYLEGKHAKS